MPANVLEHTFNISLCTGSFPSVWKESVVVPVQKAGNTSAANNYRPVSLLYAFAKVFDILAHKRVSLYFNQCITAFQHGFRKGPSIETNLCTFPDYSAPYTLGRGEVGVIYLNFSKAFYKVSHALVLLSYRRTNFLLCS